MVHLFKNRRACSCSVTFDSQNKLRWCFSSEFGIEIAPRWKPFRRRLLFMCVCVCVCMCVCKCFFINEALGFKTEGCFFQNRCLVCVCVGGGQNKPGLLTEKAQANPGTSLFRYSFLCPNHTSAEAKTCQNAFLFFGEAVPEQQCWSKVFAAQEVNYSPLHSGPAAAGGIKYSFIRWLTESAGLSTQFCRFVFARLLEKLI